MKVFKILFNTSSLNNQIDITLGQIKELTSFCKTLHGVSCPNVPLNIEEERPIALEPLLSFAENLVMERDSLVRVLEETCLSMEARIEKLSEQSANFIVPTLPSAPTTKPKKK